MPRKAAAFNTLQEPYRRAATQFAAWRHCPSSGHQNALQLEPSATAAQLPHGCATRARGCRERGLRYTAAHQLQVGRCLWLLHTDRSCPCKLHISCEATLCCWPSPSAALATHSRMSPRALSPSAAARGTWWSTWPGYARPAPGWRVWRTARLRGTWWRAALRSWLSPRGMGAGTTSSKLCTEWHHGTRRAAHVGCRGSTRHLVRQ